MRQKTFAKNLKYKFFRIDKERDIEIFPDGGWHFNDLKKPADLSKKFKSGAHQEENIDEFTNIENINTFNFIRDLKSFGTLKTRALTRKIINFWIDDNTNFLTKAFESTILSNRVSILCMTYSWFGKSGTPEFQMKLLKSISQQLKIQEFLRKYQN